MAAGINSRFFITFAGSGVVGQTAPSGDQCLDPLRASALLMEPESR